MCKCLRVHIFCTIALSNRKFKLRLKLKVYWEFLSLFNSEVSVVRPASGFRVALCHSEVECAPHQASNASNESTYVHSQ